MFDYIWGCPGKDKPLTLSCMLCSISESVDTSFTPIRRNTFTTSERDFVFRAVHTVLTAFRCNTTSLGRHSRCLLRL